MTHATPMTAATPRTAALPPYPIAPAVLDLPVEGVGIAPGTLSEQLGDGLTLLVFLRHFG